MTAIQDLVSLTFAARDYAHKQHLITESYAEHVALGEFYTALVEKIDTIVETWQGFNGKRIGKVSSQSPVLGSNCSTTLQRLLKDTEDLKKEVCEGNAALENLFDELVALYAHTIYKLTLK